MYPPVVGGVQKGFLLLLRFLPHAAGYHGTLLPQGPFLLPVRFPCLLPVRQLPWSQPVLPQHLPDHTTAHQRPAASLPPMSLLLLPQHLILYPIPCLPFPLPRFPNQIHPSDGSGSLVSAGFLLPPLPLELLRCLPVLPLPPRKHRLPLVLPTVPSGLLFLSLSAAVRQLPYR